LLGKIDGWFIPGGADMDSTDYNEPRHAMSKPNEYSKMRYAKEKYVKIMLK